MLKVKFTIFAIYIYFSYLLTGLLFLCPITIMNIFNRNIGFFIKNIHAISIGFILKYLLRVQLYVNSNKLANELVNNDEQIILIQNHISEIDFLCLSLFMLNIKKLFNFKFIGVIKKNVGLLVLGFGLISSLARDLYLDRNINLDKVLLKRNNNANILYIFPEGTCYNEHTKQISNVYVKKNNLIKYKHLLYPRITGIETIINSHKKYKKIFDFTVMYDTIDKKEFIKTHKFYEFFNKYDFPKKIFINIKKYNIEQCDNIQYFLENVFYSKDKFIENFNIKYNNFNKFNSIFYKGFISFISSIIISFVSLYLFFKFNFIKSLYLVEIICFIIYFIFFKD